MRPETITVSLSFEVEVIFHDDDVWRRCVENRGRWREMFYDLPTKEAVAVHIAHSELVNGQGLSSLDGWSDMPDSAVTVKTISLWHTAEES